MFSDILQKLERERLGKISLKLPSWAERSLEVPDELAFQQCSSQEAASFKAGLLKERFGSGLRLADLTGGLGVDSSAFATVCSAVLYNERNVDLAAAAERNFKRLGISNIAVGTMDICPEPDAWLPEVNAFAPDVIYVDPARRDASGKKVFLPEECSPDVTKILPLFPHCRFMIKLSPLADISLLRKRLPSLKEIHIVSIGGEVKELLCLSAEAESLLVDFPESGISRSFVLGEAPDTIAYGAPAEGEYLFEPSAALLKSGFQDRFCIENGLDTKADPFTHLYFSRETGEIAPDFGHTFRIVEVASLDRKGIRAVASAYPKAEITAKNLPMTTARLRERMKLESGNDFHIFAFKCPSGNLLAVTERVR